MTAKKVIIIGSGFAGLAAASFMAKEGWQVTVVEKQDTPGGRARRLTENGFTFDRGPSFYWMPDVFERYFSQFGKRVTDYYSLRRLDPSYRIYWNNDFSDIPAGMEEVKAFFESIEPGSSARLEQYLRGAAYKYRVGINNLVHKPGLSWIEFLDRDTLTGVFKLDVFSSIRRHIRRYFHHPKLRQIMEFPVLFLGALPADTPALYSLMNYADIEGGTWYPESGIYKVVEAMYSLAVELGVQFRFGENVETISIANGVASQVVTDQESYTADVVISGADYHFTETRLLPPAYQSYSATYWDKKIMAPSCLLYYVGLNKRLHNVQHHSLFFDVDFEKHGEAIYKSPQWPANPLFYVSIPSVTDASVAPPGCENMVFLVPVAAGLPGDTGALRERYYHHLIARMEQRLGQSFANNVIYKKSYAVSDFAQDYNSFRGNAYGLANTLWQTAIFKPSCRSKKVKNLFYTGQLTVPGPGVPPSLISGEVVAKQVIKIFG